MLRGDTQKVRVPRYSCTNSSVLSLHLACLCRSSAAGTSFTRQAGKQLALRSKPMLPSRASKSCVVLRLSCLEALVNQNREVADSKFQGHVVCAKSFSFQLTPKIRLHFPLPQSSFSASSSIWSRFVFLYSVFHQIQG